MKKIIIDGHNLVPKIPGLSLSQDDDETKLIGIIQEYCRLSRSQAELFFDGAQPGQSPKSKSGLVHIHNIKVGSTADDAIITYMRNFNNKSTNLVLISSDRRIQSEAKSLKIQFKSSDQFSVEIQSLLSSPKAVSEKRETPISDDEVEHWLALFNKK